MIDKNKSPNQLPDGVYVKPTKECIECKSVLTKDNLVKNPGGIGYKKLCRDCRNIISLKLSRKRAQIIKDNPLW